MTELPSDFSYELMERTRVSIFDQLIAASVPEEELVDVVSRSHNCYKAVVYYALSTFDEIQDENGVLSIHLS